MSDGASLRNDGAVARAPEYVSGYHGCSIDGATQILSGTPFRRSQNRYDWLGNGAYFWEFAPLRALDWATKRFGEQAAVLEVRIQLGFCLNLLDIEHMGPLAASFQLAVERSGAAGEAFPKNLSDGRHYLDREIIELFCKVVLETTGVSFQTVRGCYPEGPPVFPGSRILSKTHVQIAVRDPSCISNIRLVEIS